MKTYDYKDSANYPVLDHGFVQYVDHMGSDDTVANAARVSYQGQKAKRDNEGLIRYLIKHGHHTPLEQCSISFRLRAPIFVARQIFRHRTGKFNEISGRYALLKDEFYIPEVGRFNEQSTDNKQGSSDKVLLHADLYRNAFKENCEKAFELYNGAIESGLSKEVARIILPLNTYTEFVLTFDLRNLFHFLRLRLDSHAQWEVRQYAEAMNRITEYLYPVCHKAYVDLVGLPTVD